MSSYLTADINNKISSPARCQPRGRAVPLASASVAKNCASWRVSCCNPFSHDACGLAKRHGLENPKDAHDWHAAEKARNLYRKAELAALIFEAMLVGPGEARPSRGKMTCWPTPLVFARSRSKDCERRSRRTRKPRRKGRRVRLEARINPSPSNRWQPRQGPASRDAGPRRRYFSRDGSLRSGDLSPTMHMATPVTRPTISAWAG
jgi:hypothetical protein